MEGLAHGILDVLVLVAAGCGLALFLVAVLGFLVASFRVGVLGRVLVLPFDGKDERAPELTKLFARRLVEIEEQWIALARELRRLKEGFEKQSREAASATAAERPPSSEPLWSGHPLAGLRASDDADRAKAIVTAPRTTGDELIEDVLLLSGSSIGEADLGVVSVAGVSFSPNQILALVRRLPGLLARRFLSGSILALGANSVVTVTYEERVFLGPNRRARCVVEVPGEEWLPAIDDLAFKLAKERIDLLRRKRGRHRDDVGEALTLAGSETAERAVVEAESWKACEAFLDAYAAQLRHYTNGRAADRDEALQRYEDALERQPGYTRAAYNRAALLYNRYLPRANEQAIEGFEAAALSRDSRVRALAFAGLAMAYCQMIHRFGRDTSDLLRKALQASEDALKLEPDLEESRFARAWAHQAREAWDDALAAYEAVVALPTDSAPGSRIKSFARNNQGWITFSRSSRRGKRWLEAERLYWDALQLYPNKIAYANLADLARRYKRYDDALALFDRALALDDCYVNAWNEKAALEVEIAAASRKEDVRRRLLAEAGAHHARAVKLAGDPDYVGRLRRDFCKALTKHRRALRGAATLLERTGDGLPVTTQSPST